MSDGKNTEQVQGFFVKLITNANTYIGFGGGLVVGVIGGIFLAKIL
jgi:hypothetical protein